jgi:hypothetical protein
VGLGARCNIAALSASRALLAALRAGSSARFSLAIIGDSWVHGDIYWLRQCTKTLQTRFGFGGIGWVGFQWFGATSGTWVDGGSQPTGAGGCARGDLTAPPVFNGAWASGNGSGGLATPSIGNATSTAANAYVRFTFPAGHTGADLYYAGDGTGVVQYSWDGGSSWSDNLALTGVGPSRVALASVPSGSGTLRIRVVSGNVNLAGVNMISTADGVVVHKIAASGSNSSMWTAVDLAVWAAQVDSLAPDMFACLLGTNDQSGTSLPAATFGTNVAAIMGAIATQNADIERLWLGPAENTRDNAVTMAAYNAAALAVAVDQDFALYDFAKLFGPDPDDYAFGTGLGLLDATNLHPATARGGVLMANAMERLLAPWH